MPTAAAPEDETPKKSGSAGLFGLAAIAMASSASSFSTVYFIGGSAPKTTAYAGVDKPTAAPSAVRSEFDYVELPEILVSIGSHPTDRYLKVKLAVAATKEHVHEVKRAQPILNDALLAYLRALEVSDFEDPEFYPHLRAQLSRRAELVLGEAGVGGVLITEFLLR